MTFEELWEQMEETHGKAMHLSHTKGQEYSDGQGDPLKHFVDVGNGLAMTPEQVLMTFAGKHWSSLMTFTRNGATGPSELTPSEPIEGRIDDLIVYLHILKAMVREGQRNVEVARQIINPDTVDRRSFEGDAR